MGSSHRLQRALVCACLALAGAFTPGCGELLGISDPFPRAAAGSAGSAGEGAGEAGSAGTETGAAGAQVIPNPTCDQLGALRCGGDANLTPQICDGSQWQANDTINDGNDCAVLCVAGECAECASGETRCEGAQAQHCEAGAWAKQSDCAAFCLAGACRNPPSCSGAKGAVCGSDSASCCQSLEVPGGSFIRDYDGESYASKAYTATVSSFLLDRFEVNVYRFKAFVEAYDQLDLEEGAGRSPHIANDLGWQRSMRQLMPETSETLRASLACPSGTWANTPIELNYPINCVNYYVAYAFCIWDGARLPTEAEWNYAAAGGDEQRVYPWSAGPDQELDESYAFYGQFVGSPIDIGTKPKGNGRWGHSDLAGNVSEWVMDSFAAKYPTTQCTDCVNTTAAQFRTLRGGGYLRLAPEQKVSYRTGHMPDGDSLSGFRCARDIPAPALNERMVNP